jgi:hypothetical protein
VNVNHVETAYVACANSGPPSRNVSEHEVDLVETHVKASEGEKESENPGYGRSGDVNPMKKWIFFWDNKVLCFYLLSHNQVNLQCTQLKRTTFKILLHAMNLVFPHFPQRQVIWVTNTTHFLPA